MKSADDLVDKEQGFLSHLVELRERLVKIVIVVGLIFACLFAFRNDIYLAFAAPLADQLGPDANIQTIDPAGSFFAPLKLVLMMSVFLAIPFLLYQIWAFVAPGLYKHEKRLVFPLLVSSTGLFYLGVAFAHFVVFPIVFAFFVGAAPEGVQVNTDITRYLDFAITLFFAFGIAFEVPVATVILVMVGITTPDQLVKARPYVFVGAFIVGMFLTPPDFISQTLLAIPMWLLFEIGIIFSRTLKVRVKEAGDAMGSTDDSESGNDSAEMETPVNSNETTSKSLPNPPKGSYKTSLMDNPEDPDSSGP